MPESACARTAAAWSLPNSSLMRLSRAAASAMPQAVSGTSLASCGHSCDEMIAATIRMTIARVNVGAAPKRMRWVRTSLNSWIRLMTICDTGR